MHLVASDLNENAMSALRCEAEPEKSIPVSLRTVRTPTLGTERRGRSQVQSTTHPATTLNKRPQIDHTTSRSCVRARLAKLPHQRLNVARGSSLLPNTGKLYRASSERPPGH